MPDQKHKDGINPVTMRPNPESNQKTVLTLARMGFGPPMQLWITAAIYNPEKPEEEPITAVLDETVFVSALGYLFPRGELATTHLDDGKDPSAHYYRFHDTQYVRAETCVEIKETFNHTQRKTISELWGDTINQSHPGADRFVLIFKADGKDPKFLLQYLCQHGIRHSVEVESDFYPE